MNISARLDSDVTISSASIFLLMMNWFLGHMSLMTVCLWKLYAKDVAPKFQRMIKSDTIPLNATTHTRNVNSAKLLCTLAIWLAISNLATWDQLLKLNTMIQIMELVFFSKIKNKMNRLCNNSISKLDVRTTSQRETPSLQEHQWPTTTSIEKNLQDRRQLVNLLLIHSRIHCMVTKTWIQSLLKEILNNILTSLKVQWNIKKDQVFKSVQISNQWTTHHPKATREYQSRNLSFNSRMYFKCLWKNRNRTKTNRQKEIKFSTWMMKNSKTFWN